MLATIMQPLKQPYGPLPPTMSSETAYFRREGAGDSPIVPNYIAQLPKKMKRPSSETTEASGDSTTENHERPRRRCRQLTNALIEEQLLEELEDRKSALDQRTLRLKEKNKRAQQRFRERQKEKSQQATVQVQRLQRQVTELKSRTAAADDRCQLLEKLLTLNEGGQTAGTSVPEKPRRTDVGLPVFSAYDEFTPLPDTEFVMELRGCAPTSPLYMSKQQVHEMVLPNHLAIYKAYIQQMTLALEDAQGNLQTAAAQHLQGLENELLAWCHWVNKISPRVIPKMRTMNMESGSLVGPPDPQTLLAVLKRHALSEDQTAQLVAARRFCLTTLAGLMRERISMAETLKAVSNGGSSWNNMYESHPTMVDLQQRLAHNVEAESRAFHTFMSSAMRRVLNPIQAAALLVRSYPYMPNAMAVVAACSGEEAGGESDDDLLELDPVPSHEEPAAAALSLAPADSLGPALEALWNDIFLS